MYDNNKNFTHILFLIWPVIEPPAISVNWKFQMVLIFSSSQYRSICVCLIILSYSWYDIIDEQVLSLSFSIQTPYHITNLLLIPSWQRKWPLIKYHHSYEPRTGIFVIEISGTSLISSFLFLKKNLNYYFLILFFIILTVTYRHLKKELAL